VHSISTWDGRLSLAQIPIQDQEGSKQLVVMFIMISFFNNAHHTGHYSTVSADGHISCSSCHLYIAVIIYHELTKAGKQLYISYVYICIVLAKHVNIGYLYAVFKIQL